MLAILSFPYFQNNSKKDIFHSRISSIIRYEWMFEFFRGMFSMNWLTKLMYGRYGTDRLGLFMLIVVLLLDIIFTFTGWDVLYILAFVLAAICVWRIFSRNISRRYAENQKFMQLTDPIVRAISSKISGLKDLRTHRHLRCPSCGQKIRVPKGRGKIQITCPKCRHEFVKKV
nr:MAG TPA: zinc-ribbon containing domain protein [Caudoviricetes sp.]